jgi:hypothetical protein
MNVGVDWEASNRNADVPLDRSHMSRLSLYALDP